ncbi:MAG: hypothetical protein IPP93_15330 [Chitinophagaceae bacterium]|nr:hypothetical protein [Chitinophagaceae bacterium]MBL0337188.1 hypothetical protein [Chitinophagaceae bacterium]
MKGKNYLRIAGFVMMLAVAIPAGAEVITAAKTETAKTDDPRVEQLTTRLKEIRSMKVSTLSRNEKQSLRREVKEIKKEMKTIKGGVYLSVGAIIIVALLLILLL